MPLDPREVLLTLLVKLPDAAVSDLVALAQAMIRLDEREASGPVTSPPSISTRTAPPGAASL